MAMLNNRILDRWALRLEFHSVSLWSGLGSGTKATESKAPEQQLSWFGRESYLLVIKHRYGKPINVEVNHLEMNKFP